VLYLIAAVVSTRIELLLLSLVLMLRLVCAIAARGTASVFVM
jgi:hypothetical protein